jgi:hypothetical protein
MSFIINNQISFSDSANIDAFGRLRVSEPFNLFNYGSTVSSGASYFEDYRSGGTLTFNQNTSDITFSVTSSGNRLLREQHGYNIYQPGKSQLILLTGVFGTPTANVTKRMGYFNDNDGLFFASTGGTGTFGVVLRTSTSGAVVDTFIPQSQWNIDTLDTGSTLNPSGIHFDITKANIFIINFQWLGVGRVVYALDLDGQIIPVHQILNANKNTEVYMKTGTLPVRYEVTSQGGSDNTFRQICASVISEGGQDEIGYPLSISNGLTTRTFASRQAVISVRLAPLLNSQTNRTKAIPTSIELFTNTATINAYWELVLQKGYLGESNLGGSPTWTPLSGSSNPLEYSINGTTVIGGEVIDSGFLSVTNQAGIKTAVSIPSSKAFIANNYSGNTSDYLHLVITPSASSSWAGKISLLAQY